MYLFSLQLKNLLYIYTHWHLGNGWYNHIVLDLTTGLFNAGLCMAKSILELYLKIVACVLSALGKKKQ